jgi:hypothetical protein
LALKVHCDFVVSVRCSAAALLPADRSAAADADYEVLRHMAVRANEGFLILFSIADRSSFAAVQQHVCVSRQWGWRQR